MLLAIDGGNTNTVFGLRTSSDQQGMHFARWRMATNPSLTADDYAAWLAFHLAAGGYGYADIDGVIVSSVVPPLLPPLQRFIAKHIPARLYTLLAEDSSHGVPIKLETPSQAGSDRIANTAAASLYGLPAIIVDFGTATSFDCIDSDGAYCGGVIAPGVNLSVAALYRAAAQLPMLDPKEWSATMPVIGTTTRSAMNSGLFYGYVSLIEGMLGRIQAEFAKPKTKTKPTVIATGGLGELFASAIKAVDKYDMDVTLKGLGIIYDRQQHGRG